MSQPWPVFCYDLSRVFFRVPPCPYTLKMWHELDYMICGLRPSLDEIVRRIYPVFCFHLANVFLQGATMPPYTHFLNCHCGKGALCFCFELARAFLHGATMPPLHPIFLDLSCGGALCFCFDLDRVFLPDAIMPPVHHFLLIIVGRGHYTSAST